VAPVSAAPAPAMVLVVDDEPHIRAILERVLADAGHHVLLAECASAALAVVAGEPRVRVALVDQGMPGGVTPRDLDGLRAGAPGLRVVLHTGNDALPELAAVADLVLTKPVSIPVMLATIEQLIADPRR
jgi:CheY-like chemotaxis protein